MLDQRSGVATAAQKRQCTETAKKSGRRLGHHAHQRARRRDRRRDGDDAVVVVLENRGAARLVQHDLVEAIAARGDEVEIGVCLVGVVRGSRLTVVIVGVVDIVVECRHCRALGNQIEQGGGGEGKYQRPFAVEIDGVIGIASREVETKVLSTVGVGGTIEGDGNGRIAGDAEIVALAVSTILVIRGDLGARAASQSAAIGVGGSNSR